MFADRLRLLRLSKKLSQQYMADYLGITRQGYGKYESGSNPDIDTLNKLADFFGVSVDYLIGRSDVEEITEAEKAFLKDADELNIEDLIKKHIITIDGKETSKEEVEAIIAFIRSLRNLKQ